MDVQILFTPDGAGRCLHTEVIDLASLGRLAIERATTIEFEDAIQLWVVRTPQGAKLFTSPSRRKCLLWERKHLERQERLKHQTTKPKPKLKGAA